MYQFLSKKDKHLSCKRYMKKRKDRCTSSMNYDSLYDTVIYTKLLAQLLVLSIPLVLKVYMPNIPDGHLEMHLLICQNPFKHPVQVL